MHRDVPQFVQGDFELHVNDLPKDVQAGCLVGNAWGKLGNPWWMAQWSKGRREYISFGHKTCYNASVK